MSIHPYYQDQALAYFQQTVQINPASFLRPLTVYLAKGASILDIGCGSGRDMLWLGQRGYRCWGLEGASDLARLAEKHAEQPVIEADFESFDFSSWSVDALVLVGALVHVPHEGVHRILQRILTALKSGGLVLITLKQGRGKSRGEDGRVFYLWEQKEIEEIFQKLGLHILHYAQQVSKVRRSDVWMGWVLRDTQGAGRMSEKVAGTM